MTRACGREVPAGCLGDAHRGSVPVARVDAGGVGASLVGLVGGCAGESCFGVGESQLLHGARDGNHGRFGWAGAVIVGRNCVEVANDDGGRQKGETAVCQAEGVHEILGFLLAWEVRE